MNLQEHIKKVLKEETKLTPLQKKVLDSISNSGLYNTIKIMGGYNNFINFVPNYFDNKDHKIDLINEIVENVEPNGFIYFYDITQHGEDLFYYEEKPTWQDNNNHTYEHYFVNVGDEVVAVKVWEYDENGEMFDEEYDSYYIKLYKLDDKYLNKIFDVLVNYYLK
jgi:hypothetical protein